MPEEVAFGAPAYDALLTEIKERIRQARVRAMLSVNREMVLLYWRIGRDILDRQREQGWGARVVDRLSADLRREFPEMAGLSPRNLKYMRAFAEAWPDEPVVQEALAQIPWYHNLALLEKLSSQEERLWYARAAFEYGWSRNVLVHQIETRLRQRQGQAITNFERALPAPHSDLARELIKDPYNFDFLTLREEAHERELERGLLEHLRDFLLELGSGFAFLGSQYPLTVGGEDYYIDLLFYHVRLHAYVAIELKAGKFLPEYAGKMNFYLAAIDDMLRTPDDSPSIGIILCRTKDRLVAEYALRGISAPMGVSDYLVTEALPKDLQGMLPTVEQLEAGLPLAEEVDKTEAGE